jgi:Domain of unknown function (DUF4266)
MRHMSRVFSASPWRTKLIRVLATQLVFVLAAIVMAAVGGCASFGAQPRENDLLAEPAMRMDAYPLQSAVDDHIYLSKEASSGGRSYAGTYRGPMRGGRSVNTAAVRSLAHEPIITSC